MKNRLGVVLSRDQHKSIPCLTDADSRLEDGLERVDVEAGGQFSKPGKTWHGPERCRASGVVRRK